MPRKPKSVYIAWGGEQGSVPVDDPDVEIWGYNYAFARKPWSAWVGSESAFTRYFHLHMREFLQDNEPEAFNWFLEWAKLQRTFPIYTLERWPELIRNELFPVERLEALGPRGWYHAGSFDWLVLYAYAEGFQRVILSDTVELTRGTEPLSARPCLEYWMGWVEAKGMEVVLPAKTDICSIQHVVRSQSQYGTDPDFRNVVYR